MPGPPGGGQRFLPQVPFGLGLDPQGGLAGSLPPAQPPAQPDQPPTPGYVRQYTQGAGFKRRFVSPALVAPPIVAPKGGYPLAPPGTFVGLGPVDKLRRRRFLYQTIVAPPIVSTPTTFIAPAATIVSTHVLRRTRRLPPSTILPTATPAPIRPAAFVAGLGAIARPRRLRNVPPSTLLPPPSLSPEPTKFGTIVALGAVDRTRRRRPLTLILAKPIVTATTQFVAPPATNVSQAAERAIRRRSGSVQLPRLGSPPPVKSGTFVAQAVPRALTRRSVPRPHLAAAVQPSTFVAPPAVLVTAQSAARPYTRRTVPAPHLPRLGAPKPVPAGTFLAQAVARSYTRRTGAPAPHLARPLAAPAVPFRTQGFYSLQAIQRAQERRFRDVAPAPHLAPAVATRAGPGAAIYLQATQRALTRRGPAPALHLAKSVQSTPFLAPPALVVSQAVQRGWQERVSRGGRVRLPGTPGRGPVPAGLFLSQALRRPLLGRGPNPKPHLALPVVAAPVAFRSAGFLSLQAVQRTQERRFRDVVPAPHLAPRVTTPAGPGATIKLQAISRALIGRGGRVRLPGAPGRGPVPSGEFVYQAIQRSLRGRGPNPRPHLASPVVNAATFVPPVPYGTFVLQARARRSETRFRDVVPAPHLAAPVRTPAGPGATLRLVAVTSRALLGRGGHVRLPSLGAPRPVAPGTFLSQALRRPYVGRTVPRPHLAAGRVTQPSFPPNAPGLFVSQATQRASSPVSRRGHVRLAPAVLTRGRTPPTLVVSQSLLRPYVGRRVIPAHLAPPVRTKAGPGARLVYQAIQRPLTRRSVPLRPRVAPSLVGPKTVFPPRPPGLFVRQAVQRALTRRRVPVPPRYRSIVFVPSQAGVPFPVITTTGGTGPRTTPGRTAPRPTTGVTAPLAPGGTTSPTTRTGQTSPREHLP